MKDSIRRVAVALGIVGLLAFSVATVHHISHYCGDREVSCLTAAVLFGVPQTGVPTIEIQSGHAAPTTAAAQNVPSMVEFVFDLIQVTSVYLILLSVLSLVILELFELRYLRRLVRRHA